MPASWRQTNRINILILLSFSACFLLKLLDTEWSYLHLLYSLVYRTGSMKLEIIMIISCNRVSILFVNKRIS